MWDTGLQSMERYDAQGCHTGCYVFKTAEDLLTDPAMLSALEPYEARINKFLEEN